MTFVEFANNIRNSITDMAYAEMEKTMEKFKNEYLDKIDMGEDSVDIRLDTRKEAEKTLSKIINTYLEMLGGSKSKDKALKKILKHGAYFFRNDKKNGGKEFEKINKGKDALHRYWEHIDVIEKIGEVTDEGRISLSVNLAFMAALYLASSSNALGAEKVSQILKDHDFPDEGYSQKDIEYVVLS